MKNLTNIDYGSEWLGYQLKEPVKLEGVSLIGKMRSFVVVNRSVGGYLAIDGWSFPLEVGGVVRVEAAGREKVLKCIKFNN